MELQILASEPGRESIFFEPEDTKGLTGRKKAGAEFRNRIKYGAEGTLIGGGFPLIGKTTQLGYKYGLKPLLVNKQGLGVAQLGAKAIDNTVMKGAKLLLGNKYVAPLTRAGSETLQNAGKFTTAKIIANNPKIPAGRYEAVLWFLYPNTKAYELTGTATITISLCMNSFPKENDIKLGVKIINCKSLN